jgi:hypothetical protein
MSAAKSAIRMTIGSQRDLAPETNARIEYWYGAPVLLDRKRSIQAIGISNAKTNGYKNRTSVHLLPRPAAC